MKILRKYIKPIAALLFLNAVYYIASPSVVYALTAGPTAPEYTSFEPVDTTDMVNLATGDLAYNIPLLEVPGPAGGYPLSMSYHAGISPGLEASWVGLGWTLNAGAINRTVSGFPDDYRDIEQTDRTFWEGGVTRTYTLGASYGLPLSPATSVGAGFTIGSDTYQGVGVGLYASVGHNFGWGEGNTRLGAGINATVGTTPFGDAYASVGGNLGLQSAVTESISASAGLGVSYGTQGLAGGLSGGLNYKQDRNTSYSLLGASIGSNSGGASFSVGGGSRSVINAKSNNISTDGYSIGLDIPIVVVPGLNIRLGHSYQRYWIDESSKSETNGSINFLRNKGESSFFDDKEYDIYDNLSIQEKLDNTYNADLRGLNGSFPDYDQYFVSAQGIGGAIRPYQYQTYLDRQNFLREPGTNEYTYRNLDLGANINKPQFRFVGDFSNRLNVNDFELTFSGNNTDPIEISELLNFTTGENGNDGFLNGELFGSKHIQYFTNDEIINGTAANAGLIISDDEIDGFIRKSGSGIGGYMITNESGVTYHFSLPVYSSDEYTLSRNTKQEGQNFNQLTKIEPYAYTWLLTAVTGADFVPRGEFSLDKDDYGYWVKFNYGLWTDNYKWRNPGEGANLDIDNVFEVFSKGRKEIYYLDEIKTATHTAIFVKDLRNDVKGVTSIVDEGFAFRLGTNNIDHFDQGGYVPKEITRNILTNSVSASFGYDFPMPSLKLSSVLLYENEDLLENGSEIFNKRSGKKTLPVSYEYENEISGETNTIYFPNEDRVIMSSDIAAKQKKDAIREIVFDQDYSLMEGTPNSFVNNFYNNRIPSTDPDDYEKTGKLTLNAITYNGKGAAPSLVPPMRFYYDNANGVSGIGTLNHDKSLAFNQLIIDNSSEQLNLGDYVKIISDKEYFVRVVGNGSTDARLGSNVKLSEVQGSELPEGNYNVDWKVTNNFLYNKEFYDNWGSFKSDFRLVVNNTGFPDPNVNRITTPTSAQLIDAWSLKRIKTSLGSNIVINYESDDYNKSVLNKGASFNIDNPFPSSGNSGFESSIIPIKLATDGINLEELVHSNDMVDVTYSILKSYANRNCNQENAYEARIVTAMVERVDLGNTIVVKSEQIRDEFNSIQTEDDGCEYRVADVKIANVSLPRNLDKYGGGLRVKDIRYIDPVQNIEHITSYNYNDPNTGQSSGVTSYEPSYFDNVSSSLSVGHRIAVQRVLFSEFEHILDYSRDIPGPGVLYNYVTVSESIKVGNEETFLPNKSIYNFQTFEPKMIKPKVENGTKVPDLNSVVDGLFVKDINIQNNSLSDLSSSLGSLKSIELYATEYDDNGIETKENLLSRTENHYLYDLASSDNDQLGVAFRNEMDEFNNLGVLEEASANARYVEREEESIIRFYDIYGSTVKKAYFPNIQTGQTTYNYKNGGVNRSRNLAFDFYSGQPTETYSEDVYGNKYVSAMTPAYRMKERFDIPTYQRMGVKDNSTFGQKNKNMLVQEGASVIYKLADSFDPDVIGTSDWRGNINSLVGASVQTWQNGGQNVLSADAGLIDQGTENIFRQKAAYQFIGSGNTLPDGTFANNSFVNGIILTNDGSAPSDMIGWRKNGEATLYDVNSHVLEAKDINGNYAATKFDSEFEEVYSSATNAAYDEFAFSGAEDLVINDAFGGGVLPSDGIVIPDSRHTGQFALAVPANAKGFSFTVGQLTVDRTYKVSVWTNNPEATLIAHQINGLDQPASQLKVNAVGNWYQVSTQIKVPANTSDFEISVKTSGSNAILDDFMAFPVDAGITAYVYNEWGELSDVIDRNNLPTHYEYDAMGRLKSTWAESFQYGKTKISETNYHYANQD